MTLATLAHAPGRCANGYDLRTQHPILCQCSDPAPVAPTGEWDTFLAALRSSARDGRISQTDVRPKIQTIVPKHRGTLYRRAVAEGLIRQDGWEDSTDVAGRNADKVQRTYIALPKLLAHSP